MTAVHEAGARATAHARPSRRPRLPRKAVTALAVAPAGLLILAFAGYPLVQSVWLSLTDWSGIGSAHFVGLRNFRAAFSDGSVAHSTLVTVQFAFLTAAGTVVVATLLAVAVSAGARGSAFYRIVWFLPGIAPVTAVAIFWAQSMAPQQGAVNVVLGWLGLGDTHAWLAGTSTAIYPTIGAAVWAGVGFAFVLILGATEQIDVSLYEAATIDGAGRVRQFVSITLPMIRPVLTVTTMLEVVWAANGFTMVWAMTNGGPGNATTTLPVLIYQQAFQFTNYGLASAMAVLSGVALFVLGLIGLRMSTSRQGAQA
ncbi:sugar ABC transporter permease [Streptomyces sp. NPDC046862]|uniref:carbohydrate ABC transporter permease n=1 Tax=Streptomyces sp. NPDC046862 TaxID=3154603 RepID=UPI0034544BE6